MKTGRVLAFVSMLVLCSSLGSAVFAEGTPASAAASAKATVGDRTSASDEAIAGDEASDGSEIPADVALQNRTFLLNRGVTADEIDKMNVSDINSLVQQTKAYHFTDDQVQKYVQGLITPKVFPDEKGIYDKETGTFKTSAGECPNLFRDWKSPTDNPIADLHRDQGKRTTSRITVHIPTFQVTINDVKIDNSHREYPLLTYKGMTYIPLTYRNSLFLGLETTWDNQMGLSVNISKGAFSWSSDETYTTTKNKMTYSASFPQFPIWINGEQIDNQTEPYPLILFRDVTYFPLTWHFAMDEFHWLTYSFTAKDGLVINSFYPPPSYEDALPALHQGLVEGPSQYEKNGLNQSGNQNGQSDSRISSDQNQTDQSAQNDAKDQDQKDQSDQGNQKDSNDQNVTNGQ